jgi:hypothetical protein
MVSRLNVCLDNPRADRPEYAYGFKYPEMNGRSDGGERWSVRQTAIYHQHNLQDQRSVWIILNARPQSLASTTVERFLKAPDAANECIQNPFTIDELLMTSHLRMWTPYIRSYERTIIDVVSRPVISHLLLVLDRLNY